MSNLQLGRCCRLEFEQECVYKESSSLPAPQKFAPKSAYVLGKSKLAACSFDLAGYRRLYSKAMGQVIVREECAQWLDGPEEQRVAASGVADLILAYDR